MNPKNQSPALTVDCVVFGRYKKSVQLLLIRRNAVPFIGFSALPGGFVGAEEDLEKAAQRVLEEETGVGDIFFEQLFTFGNKERDPRGRVVSVAYYALVNMEDHKLNRGENNQDARWYDLKDLPELAFDHQDIVNLAIDRLKGKLMYQPIGFELLPEKFTLSDLQDLYEGILGVALNKRNFRTRILKMGILRKLERQEGVPHRPAFLYEFDKEKYMELKKGGFSFQI